MRVEGVTEHILGAENLIPVRSRAVPDFRETLATIQGPPLETASLSAAAAAAAVSEVTTTHLPARAAQPAQTQDTPQPTGAPARHKGFLQAVFEGIVQAFKGIWAGLRGISVGNGTAHEAQAPPPPVEPPFARGA